MIRNCCLAAVAALGVLPAQQTWIVESGSPTNFNTIQAAVNAASDGDIILLRRGASVPYAWNFVLNKGVSIIGDNGSPRTWVRERLVISGLNANQRVVLRSLEPSTVLGHIAMVDVQNCAGQVVLDDVVLNSEDPTGTSHGDALTVQNSSHVAVHRSQSFGAPGVRVTGSSITVTQSSLTGRSSGGRFNATVGEGMQATGSSVWLSGSTVMGGGGSFGSPLSSPGATSLVLRNSTVLAAGAILAGHTFPAFTASVDLDGTSWLSRDAATVFQTNPIGATSNLVVLESGRLSGGLGATGQPHAFQLDALPGTFGLLAVALPGPRQPTIWGSQWLDQGTLSVLAAGAVPVQGSVLLPSWVQRGTLLAVQGAVLNQGMLVLSTPLLSTTP